jgi:hypothetical protein
MTDRYVISHTGKKGGPWEAQDGVLGTPTTRLSKAALVDRESRMLANIRLHHPHAKVFRLVRKAKATYPALRTAEDVIGFQRGLAAQIAFGAVMGHGPRNELEAVLSATARAIASTPAAPIDTSPEERAVVEAALAAEDTHEPCRGCAPSPEEWKRTEAIRALRAKRGG